MDAVKPYLNWVYNFAKQVYAWLNSHQTVLLVLGVLLLVWLIVEVRRGRKAAQAGAAQALAETRDAARSSIAPYVTCTLYSQQALAAFRNASKSIDTAFRRAVQNGAEEDQIRHLALVRNPSGHLAREVNLVLYDSLTQKYYRSLQWGLDLVPVGKEDYLFVEESPISHQGVIEMAGEIYGVAEDKVSPYLESGRRSILFLFFRDAAGRAYLSRRQFADGPQGLQPSFPAEVFSLS